MTRARVRALAAATTAALVLQGCTAALVQTNEPDADVYVDGRRIRPDGKVPHSVGPPHTARVLVIAKDGRRARVTVSRRPWLGFALAAYGLWPCVLFCWNYPSPTIVTLPPRDRRSSWDDAPAASAWDLPPGAAWSGNPAPTATPTTTATATPTPTPTATPTELPPHHW